MPDDAADKIRKAIQELSRKSILVGIPAEKDARDDGPMGNAALGFIHEHGSPAANIPARPFLAPGIEAAQDQITGYLEKAAVAALNGQPFEEFFRQAGQAAVNSVDARIRAGIPPPLTPGTIAGRRRRSAGSDYRRKASSATDVTPLIDTGALLGSITYIIRDE